RVVLDRAETRRSAYVPSVVGASAGEGSTSTVRATVGGRVATSETRCRVRAVEVDSYRVVVPPVRIGTARRGRARHRWRSRVPLDIESGCRLRWRRSAVTHHAIEVANHVGADRL